MKNLKIPMTSEEFELMEWKLGWKHEYWDGYARLAPRYNGVLVKLPVEKRELEPAIKIRSVSESDYEQLVGAFYDAFVDTVEYCNRVKRDVKESAQRNIRDYFDGERGIPDLALSKAAVAPRNKNRIVGAALVSKYKYGYKNEILFVRPKYQNAGIGTALVTSVLNDLQDEKKRFSGVNITFATNKARLGTKNSASSKNLILPLLECVTAIFSTKFGDTKKWTKRKRLRNISRI